MMWKFYHFTTLLTVYLIDRIYMFGSRMYNSTSFTFIFIFHDNITPHQIILTTFIPQRIQFFMVPRVLRLSLRFKFIIKINSTQFSFPPFCHHVFTFFFWGVTPSARHSCRVWIWMRALWRPQRNKFFFHQKNSLTSKNGLKWFREIDIRDGVNVNFPQCLQIIHNNYISVVSQTNSINISSLFSKGSIS